MAREYSEKYTVENSYYKSVIRDYIKAKLLDPLRIYPTTIRDALLYVITTRLEDLYLYTVRFPEIVSPNSNRLDILNAILAQFEFTIRKEADIEEQIAILENILHVYSKRGSVDTIENMWKYYGGDLPKEVKVNIPSSRLFRYSISEFSGTHVFQDSSIYRTGVYEIILYNSNYPIDKLRDFVLKELVAAGNRVYFTNSLYSLLVGEDAAYKYEVNSKYTFVHLDLRESSYLGGMSWSGYGGLSRKSELSMWSGPRDLLFELTMLLEMSYIDLCTFIPQEFEVLPQTTDYVIYFTNIDHRKTSIVLNLEVSYTPEDIISIIERHLYDSEGNLIVNTSSYPGYFILAETLLGSEVI